MRVPQKSSQPPTNGAILDKNTLQAFPSSLPIQKSHSLQQKLSVTDELLTLEEATANDSKDSATKRLKVFPPPPNEGDSMEDFQEEIFFDRNCEKHEGLGMAKLTQKEAEDWEAGRVVNVEKREKVEQLAETVDNIILCTGMCLAFFVLVLGMLLLDIFLGWFGVVDFLDQTFQLDQDSGLDGN
eukprot:snap_masked-scaffold_5-processed-gene-12.37-mRNA-1 protein AED:1.00 eAED:1.00 QI:0/-1/0/0/-1/1/1/0/183